jgi:hypothetical protein
MNVCDMAVVLRKNNTAGNSKNPWLADSVSIVVPTPAYEITSQPVPICQMAVNTPIGENAITGYSYQWNPSTYLSAANTTPTNFTYDYLSSPLPDGGVLQYLVIITRPNGCTSVDTVFVPLKGIPDVQAVDDTIICHGGGLSVCFEDNTGSGVPVTEFNWIVEDVTTGAIAETGLPVSGTGDINVSSLVNSTGASIVARCIVTPRKDGCDGVADTFNITVLPSSILNYPDIRLSACRGTTVNLSKYIDTVEFPTIVWHSTSVISVSPSGEVVINGSLHPGVATFTYEVTNRCISTALVRKTYLQILSNNIHWRRDTIITVCYEKAAALQINQIFGIESGGTFSYVADDGSDITPYIKESSTYGGAITMNGKAIYENTSARKVTITYEPGNCLAGRKFTITIILSDV